MMNSVANVRTRDYIIKNIREQILSGGFPAGMSLAQEELAEGLGVSRIPVREALQILEEQGLVARLPNRHMVVVEITGEQFHQIYQTIGTLQHQYGRFILESGARELFLEALSLWDGREEMTFHRLFSAWLDNGYLSRQFDNMLDTHVEYACSLPECEPPPGSAVQPGPAGQPGASDGLMPASQPRDGAGADRRQTAELLIQVRQAYVQGADEQVPALLGQYYGLLEEKAAEERTRHLCRD